MTIAELFAHVDNLFAEKRIDQVEPFLRGQLAEAEAAGDQAKTLVVCNELGGFYRAAGRLDQGLPLYEKALAAVEALGETGSENHAVTLINYGTTLAAKSAAAKGAASQDAASKAAAAKSLACFEQATQILRRLGLDRDYRMAALYNNASLLCQENGEYDAALDHLFRALDVLNGLEGSEIEIATTYSNAAQIHILRRDIGEAARACSKSLAIFEQAAGDSDVHYAAAIETRGRIKLAQGDREGAAEDFARAISLAERDYGPDAPLCAALRQLISSIERR